jgi:hypothetical protein
LFKFLLAASWIVLATISAYQNWSVSPHSNIKGDGEMKKERDNSHPYVGMWVTADGYIRHELLPNGRYDEARGNRKSAYQGGYIVKGNHIEYIDDTGFTADGDFVNGVLYHAGMVLYREDQREGRSE